MKNTLKSIVESIILAGVLAGCTGKDKQTEEYSAIPKPAKNQAVLMHPDYLCGHSGPSYTLLTDIDSDGLWDCVEKVHIGFTNGDYSKQWSIKQGYLERSPNDDVQIVDSNFFKPYQ